MSEILLNKIIQGYHNICEECGETIQVNMQGTPINHKCEIKNLDIPQKVDFLSFFDKNGFIKNGDYYEHDELINLTIVNSTVLNQIQYTLGFKNKNSSFFGMSKNIRTAEELQEVLFIFCGFKTYI